MEVLDDELDVPDGVDVVEIVPGVPDSVAVCTVVVVDDDDDDDGDDDVVDEEAEAV